MLQLNTDTLAGLPALITAHADEETPALADRLTTRRTTLRNWLQTHGALLLRGFGIDGAAALEAVCETGTPGLVPYVGGGSPRTLVTSKVYTSTEYAADQPIPLHCEYTYFPAPPAAIWFFCEQTVSWHIATHGEAMARRLRQLYRDEQRIPKHATFGDAEPIPDADIAHILEVLSTQEQTFRWQAGDVLVCDNHPIAHERRPFSGERRVLVALAA